jgi:hypothetical protein
MLGVPRTNHITGVDVLSVASRIAAIPTPVSEIAAWQRRRNDERAGIDWLLTVEPARESSVARIPADHVSTRALALAACGQILC